MWVRAFAGMLAIFLATAKAAPEPQGAALYKEHCAQCHDAVGASRVPSRSALAQLPVAEIEKALTSGVMKQQGAGLTAEQRTEVAKWLSSVTGSETPKSTATNVCAAGEPAARSDRADWTSWGGAGNQRYQADSGLAVEALPHLKLKWAFGVPDTKLMRSQPVVFRGRLYLGTDTGMVFALDARTGCTYWSTQLKNVRSGLTIGKAGTTEALFFGDVTGVAHALELATGKELWQAKIADHPAAMSTGTPAYADGRLYVPLSSYEEVSVLAPNYPCCTFRGSVSSLDAATGKILWRSYTIDERPDTRGKTQKGVDMLGPSGAGVWSSPTIDTAHNALYITTGDNYSDPATLTSDALLALDLRTGKRLWSRQFTANDVFNLANFKGPDYDFGASPLLVALAGGKRALLLGQKSGMVYAVDPDDGGKLLWQQRAGKGGALGGVQWGPATDGRLFYVAVSDIAFRKSTDLNHMNPDPAKGGGLTAFEVSSGEPVWKAAPPVCGDRPACSPAQSAAVTAISGAVFSGSLDGHIRAYSSADGKVLWDFDTERSFETVNHVAAEGGSLDVSGPVVAEGMVFVSSGYPQYGGKGGNVLLAFGAQ